MAVGNVLQVMLQCIDEFLIGDGAAVFGQEGPMQKAGEQGKVRGAQQTQRQALLLELLQKIKAQILAHGATPGSRRQLVSVATSSGLASRSGWEWGSSRASGEQSTRHCCSK